MKIFIDFRDPSQKLEGIGVYMVLGHPVYSVQESGHLDRVVPSFLLLCYHYAHQTIWFSNGINYRAALSSIFRPLVVDIFATPSLFNASPGAVNKIRKV